MPKKYDFNCIYKGLTGCKLYTGRNCKDCQSMEAKDCCRCKHDKYCSVDCKTGEDFSKIN